MLSGTKNTSDMGRTVRIMRTKIILRIAPPYSDIICLVVRLDKHGIAK